MTRNMFLFVMIVQSHNSAPIFSFMAYHQIYNKIIMTGDISGTETLILSKHLNLSTVFSGFMFHNF